MIKEEIKEFMDLPCPKIHWKGYKNGNWAFIYVSRPDVRPFEVKLTPDGSRADGLCRFDLPYAIFLTIAASLA